MPDVMVIQGEPSFKLRSNCIITNPYLIVEILSPSTKNFDLSEKLPEYKLLNSLQQVIYVNPKRLMFLHTLAPKIVTLGLIKIFIVLIILS